MYLEIVQNPDLFNMSVARMEVKIWQELLACAWDLQQIGAPVYCAGYLSASKQAVEIPPSSAALQELIELLHHTKQIDIPTHLRSWVMERAAPLQSNLKRIRGARKNEKTTTGHLQQAVRQLFWQMSVREFPSQKGKKQPQRIQWKTIGASFNYEWPEHMQVPQNWFDFHMMSGPTCQHLLDNQHNLCLTPTCN